MREQSVLEFMKTWGYYLLPRSHPHSPGYTGLLVMIRQQPTDEHFDPQTLHLRLRDAQGFAKWRTLSLLSTLPDSDHVCPGPVTLHDRFDKRVDFFTFGGSLAVTSGPGEEVYSLRSPAPILELGAEQSLPNQLASETELLMGEIEPKWKGDEDQFGRRLAEVDPLTFYRGALQSMLLHHEHARTHALGQAYPELYDALQREREWLIAKGLWPAAPPTLENLLAPG
ncbi:MAG: hypothetical protein KKA73_14580 [Chloroflexi bacterium]|nr:hypothetical protein [Chloroflexota bacterium]MBU1748911.1 hypothetical protein [Chloroflexota bacterium]MBU1877507.1 hypothetical protein [Chloroflexota bacterium]